MHFSLFKIGCFFAERKKKLQNSPFSSPVLVVIVVNDDNLVV